MNEQDSGYSPAHWQFDDEVTRVFDDMLRRSIPYYETMRRACIELATQYARPYTEIIDLGASRGESLAPLVEHFGRRCTYRALEVSPPMVDALRTRFGAHDYVMIDTTDLRDWIGLPPKASVVQAILTVQFTPIEYRLRLLRQCYQALHPGGALILVEKVIGGSATLDETFVELYYNLKRVNGYTQDEINRKRLALEGVLVPLTAQWNESSLRLAGFTHIDCFWRWMNFAGWIAVKERD